MKWVIAVFLLIGMWMMQHQTEEAVEPETEDQITVSWMRDAQSGERNAVLKAGSFFVSERSTVYGADCTGCTLNDGIAQTSAQIEVTTESVRQSDGKWKMGITYDGYYLIAADAAFPMCTVVRISEHSYSGAGLVPDEPFLALVVDRGSMITENTIDLFAGSEQQTQVTHTNLSGAVIEVIGFLNYQKDEQGRMKCTAE